MLAVDQSKKTFLKESDKGSINLALVLRLSHVADRILRGAVWNWGIQKEPHFPQLGTLRQIFFSPFSKKTSKAKNNDVVCQVYPPGN